MMRPAYPPEEARGVWVFLEQQGKRLEDVSLELLGKGRELADARGTELVGLLLGYQVEHLARQAIGAGADRVVLADHPLLDWYSTDGYTIVTEQAVRQGKPDVFLLGATENGRDLAGRLAVVLRTGLTADCTGLDLDREKGLLLSEVAGFGGGILATITCPQHRPQMATVRPGIFPQPAVDEGRAGVVESLPVTLKPEQIRTQVLERVTHRGADITKARHLVVGGAGTQGDFRLLEELAGLLGGEVGATRVAVDKGWASREQQIGQTGYVTRPRLAITCGVSGAMQFTVGIEAAERVVAINTDAEAPIFEQADYCVVDDMFRVLPPLIEHVRRATGAGRNS